MSSRLRVLVSAYACEPEKGSEPGVGWNWVQQLSRAYEVWVITRANNRGAIEKALADRPLPHAHWVYFDLPRWARFWKNGQRGVHLYYYLWQIGAYAVGRRLHRDIGFALVHHATIVNYWLPSFLSMLPVPFLWGPVGGGDRTPERFYSTFSPRGRLYECARNQSCWLGEHDPFVQRTARRARLSLAATPETAARLERLGCQSVEVLSQVALSGDELRRLGAIPQHATSPFRLLSIGRLLHLKGFHLGLMAFARLQRVHPTSEYWIIGDGPERHRLQKLARELAIEAQVRFLGALSRPQVFGTLAESSALVHPSLHDSGGLVCVEAMAAGRPVICLGLGGPALQVTEDTGCKVPALSPEQVISDLAQAMAQLARDPTLRARMGQAGRQRAVEHFSWDNKGACIQQAYDKALAPGR